MASNRRPEPSSSGACCHFPRSNALLSQPTRQSLADWLHGRTPMLASNWSWRAALLLEVDALQSGRGLGRTHTEPTV